jgi:hypothetical protein
MASSTLMVMAAATAISVTTTMICLAWRRLRLGRLLGFMDQVLALRFLRLRWRPRLDGLMTCPHRFPVDTARRHEARASHKEPVPLLSIGLLTSGRAKLHAHISSEPHR